MICNPEGASTTALPTNEEGAKVGEQVKSEKVEVFTAELRF